MFCRQTLERPIASDKLAAVLDMTPKKPPKNVFPSVFKNLSREEDTWLSNPKSKPDLWGTYEDSFGTGRPLKKKNLFNISMTISMLH
jgi:hypothetical protein